METTGESFYKYGKKASRSASAHVKSRNHAKMNSSAYSNKGELDVTKLADDMDTNYEDEERREVSTILRQLRKTHDTIKGDADKLETRLKKRRAEIDQIEGIEVSQYGEEHRQTQDMEVKGDVLEETRTKHEFETLNHASYLHMIERMKRDIIANEIKRQKMEANLKQKKMIMNEEDAKLRKSRETEIQARTALNGLMKSIDFEQRKQQEKLDYLQKTIRNKNDAAIRRDERHQRQLEIAEAAANEDKDSNEVRMRETFLLQKYLNTLLKKKMEKEMTRSEPIEEAYQKIRAATGLHDINAITTKFLTREETYSDLLQAVSEAESKINLLKHKNNDYKKKLELLSINDDPDAGNRHYVEIDRKEGQYSKESKEYLSFLEKYQKAGITYEQVYKWSERLVQKLEETHRKYYDTILPINVDYLDTKPDEKGERLTENFRVVASIVSATIGYFIEQEGEIEQRNVKDEDLDNSMLDPTVARNIRVRPSANKPIDTATLSSVGMIDFEDPEEEEIMYDIQEVRRELKKHARSAKFEEMMRKQKKEAK